MDIIGIWGSSAKAFLKNAPRSLQPLPVAVAELYAPTTGRIIKFSIYSL